MEGLSIICVVKLQEIVGVDVCGSELLIEKLEDRQLIVVEDQYSKFVLKVG